MIGDNFSPEDIRKFRARLLSQETQIINIERDLPQARSEGERASISEISQEQRSFENKFLEFQKYSSSKSVPELYQMLGELFRHLEGSNESKDSIRELLLDLKDKDLPDFKSVKKYIMNENKLISNKHSRKNVYEYFHHLESEFIYNPLFKYNEFKLIDKVSFNQLNSTDRKEAPARLYLLNIVAIRINRELEKLNENNQKDFSIDDFNSFINNRDKFNNIKEPINLFSKYLKYDLHNLRYSDQKKVSFYEEELNKQINKLLLNNDKVLNPENKELIIKTYRNHLLDIFSNKEFAPDLRIKLLAKLDTSNISEPKNDFKRDLTLSTLRTIDFSNIIVKEIPNIDKENIPRLISNLHSAQDDEIEKQIEQIAINLMDNSDFNSDLFQRVLQSLIYPKNKNMIDKFKLADSSTPNFESFKGSIKDFLNYAMETKTPSLDQKLKSDLKDIVIPILAYKDDELSLKSAYVLNNYINKAENLRQFNLITNIYNEFDLKKQIPDKYKFMIEASLSSKADYFKNEIQLNKTMNLNLGNIRELSEFIENLKKIKPEIRESLINITLDSIKKSKVSFDRSNILRNIRLALEKEIKMIQHTKSNQASSEQ